MSPKKPYKPIAMKDESINAILMDEHYEDVEKVFISAMSAWIDWKEKEDAKKEKKVPVSRK